MKPPSAQHHPTYLHSKSSTKASHKSTVNASKRMANQGGTKQVKGFPSPSPSPRFGLYETRIPELINSRILGDLNSIAVFIWQAASDINQRIQPAFSGQYNTTAILFDTS